MRGSPISWFEQRQPPRRRALRATAAFALGVMGLGRLPPARAQNTDQPAPQMLQIVLPPGPRFDAHFDVRADGTLQTENRVVFGTLRSTAPIAAVTLLDPAQRPLWRRTAAELGRVAAARAARPELGDALVLPEIRNAAPGRWTLRLERNAPDTAAGRLLLAWSVLPRHLLELSTPQPTVAPGQPLFVTVRASDYGVPLAGLGPIELTLLDAAGNALGSPSAVENARSADGVVLNTEPGSYLAQLRLPGPGSYRLQARHAFGAGRAPTRSAVVALSAAGGASRVGPVALHLDVGAGAGCGRGVVLGIEVDVAEAGLYACNVWLRAGDPAAPRASGSARLAGGRATIEVKVSAAKWREAGLPAVLARVALVRMDAPAGAQLIAEASGLSLPGHEAAAAALCR